MRHIIRASALAAACCLSLTACSDSDDKSDPQPSPHIALRLGQSADTAGVGGRGTAQITPDAVVYVDKAGAETRSTVSSRSSGSRPGIGPRPR